MPVYPPGGSYEVNYKGVAQPFVLPNPDAENRQVILRPVAVLNPAGDLTEMQWTYRNISGSPTSPPSFIASIQIRIDGIGGRLYDGNISLGQTNHVLSFPVVWTNVSSVQMVYDDTLGNQYVKFWNRQDQPLQNVSGPLPPATLGVQFHYLFVAAGGASPYSWSMLAGSLPPGMTFTPVTGEINGSPTATGLFPFTVRVTDQRGGIVDTVTTLRVTGGAGLRLESRPMPGPGGFGLSFFGETGRSYSLEYSLTLTNWFTILTTNSPGGQIDLVDPTATNQFRYYRLRLNSQP